MANTKSNLFVYGSLREPEIFKSVCGLSFTVNSSKTTGKTLKAVQAILARHKKVSPDNVYFYAITDRLSKIEGFLIYNIPADAMAEIDRYEGKRYKREAVSVSTAKGRVKAQAYLVSDASMRKHFGDRFHVNLIHELWLRKRIEEFIKDHTRPGELTKDAKLERRAHRELLGTTERDLIISHYRSDAVSDYYLEHELDRPLPSIKHLYEETEAEAYIENYLALVTKQVLLNQIEHKIHSRYRFELDHIRSSQRYFNRSISLLMALQMMNSNRRAVDLIIRQAIETMPYRKYDLIDYVKYAIHAADSISDLRVARSHLRRIRNNFHPGLIPLGLEIELSNMGPSAVEPRRSLYKIPDPMYDGFKYFHDFCLGVLSWKLGGYIDDHTGSTDYARRVGFLELAPGRLNIEGELSRPATADPWLLNQLIQETVKFYNVRPHSLHLSFQLRKNQIGKQKVLPLGFVKCLLVLGGGIQQKKNGGLWVSRMGYDEIIQDEYGEELVFARTSKRKWYLGEDDIGSQLPVQVTTHIQQYKFIRLEERANYEPLIMCLKGLQLEYNPADYLSSEQLAASSKLRREYEQLKEWAAEPTEISSQTITRFVKTIQAGLMQERHHKPVHQLHYIDWAVNAINVQLQMFNKHLKKTLSS